MGSPMLTLMNYSQNSLTHWSHSVKVHVRDPSHCCCCLARACYEYVHVAISVFFDTTAHLSVYVMT